MGILRMPIEIISLIIELLHVEDLFSWRLSCQHFGYILQDEGLCRVALRQAKFSAEYRDAHTAGGAYSQGLRRLIKRRTAVRTANPFLVSIVAVANNFIFANGAICYSYARDYLRLLVLRGQVTEELEINSRQLLRSVIPELGRRVSFRCKPLYYCDGILSCVYTCSKQGASTHWLLVIQTKPARVLSACLLDSTVGIFVRNNDRHLYYGTRSAYSDDRYRRWVLRGFDLETLEWSDQRLVLWNLVGADIGSTICFEIFDGYLYGLSSQTMFEPAEDKWNSFYYACRFRLGKHTALQVLPRPSAWRRRGRDGPIDDRWSLLELSRDEESGKLFIFESRKEWLPVNSQSQRTCYRKELVFPPPEPDDMRNLQELAGEQEATRDPEGWDSEAYFEERSREDLHIGDNGSTGTTFTFNDTLISSYNTSCRTFVDLVNDPAPASPGMQRLRLRIRSRGSDPCPPAEGLGNQSTGQPASPGGDRATLDHEVEFWPREYVPDQPEPLLDHLYHMLNPQAPAEGVQWGADERFIVYSPKNSNKNQLRAIVLISFDPSLRLPGLRKFSGGSTDQKHIDTTASSRSSSAENRAEGELDSTPESSSTLSDLNEAVATELSWGTSLKSQPRAASTVTDSSSASWANTQKAFYLSIEGSGPGQYGFDLTR